MRKLAIATRRVLLAAMSQPPSSPSPAAASNIVPWDESRAFRHERGFRLPFVDASLGAHQLAMHVSEIGAGLAPHEPHEHAGEEIIFVLEGTVEALVGNERKTVGPHTAIFCPEHVLHGIRNVGSNPMRYVVVRVPEKRAES